MMMGVPARAEVLERLREAGCRRAIHWLPSGGAGVVEAGARALGAAIAAAAPARS